MREIVYLGGPINGMTDEQASGWRNQVRPILDQAGFLVSDPMVRDYRGREDECVKEIVELDKKDIQQADILLMSCPRPSIGTAMEVYFAWTIRMASTKYKRIIAVVPPDKPVSPWLRYHATEIFFGTEVDAVRELLLP